MKIVKGFRNLIKSADLFGTTQFFRYKSQEGYQSLFGGLASTIILIVVVSIFFDRTLKCFNKVNISSSLTQTIADVPPLMNISTYPKGNFMAAWETANLYLQDPNIRVLDYECTQYRFIMNETTKRMLKQEFVPIPLEVCTMKHWQGFPDIADDIKLLNLDKMLCLPLNFTFQLMGKYISLYQYNLQFSLYYTLDCNDTSKPKCMSDEDVYAGPFKDQSTLKLQMYFINYQVTPGTQNPVTYFLDDRYYAPFNWNQGSNLKVFFQDYNITTDQSISFMESPQVQTGFLVQQAPSRNVYQLVNQKPVATITLAKSYIRKSYERKFEKLEDIFSIAGGLFGILCVSLFIIKNYNNPAYQVALGSQLFVPNDSTHNKVFKKYNFFNYVKQFAFGILNKLRFKKKWQSTIEYNSCEKEVKNQLDIVYLLERFLFLESAVKVVLEDHQVKALHLRQKFSLKDARTSRQVSDFKKQVNKLRRSKLMNGLTQQGLVQKAQQSIKKNQTFAKNGKDVKKTTNEAQKDLEMEGKQEFSDQSEVQRSVQENEKSIIGNQNEQKNKKVIEDLAKIQNQAKKGHRMSKKIMDFSKINLNELMNSSASKEKMEKIKQKVIINPIEIKDIKDEVKEIKDEVKEISNQGSSDQEGEQQNGFSPRKQKQKQNKNVPPQNIDQKYGNKIWRWCKNWVKSMDVFCATQFFRYKYESDSKTVFGGLVSLLLIAGLGALFYGRILVAINKQTIYTSEESEMLTDPAQLNFTTAPKGNFMAMFMSTNLPINFIDIDTTIYPFRTLDLELQNKFYRYNESTNDWDQQVIKYDLEPCTKGQWQTFPNLESQLQILHQQKNKLCFPMNTTFSIKGKSTSKEYRTLELIIKGCESYDGQISPCFSSKDILESYLNYFGEEVFLFMSNNLINPSTQNYLSQYIHDLVHFVFRSSTYNTASVLMEEFSITTDQSIFPWTDQASQTGYVINELPRFQAVLNTFTNHQYAAIVFKKSPISRNYYRSYQKVANVFAFIGGIFGIILSTLVIVNSYNSLSYQITLGSKLFKPDQKQKKILKKYNFFTFITQSIHFLLSKIGFNPKWDSATQYEKCQQQIQKQLDVPTMLQRLQFLQTAISTIMQEHQVKTLHLREKISLDQAKNQRKAFQLKKQINKFKKQVLSGQKSQELNDQKNLGKNHNILIPRDSPSNFIKRSEIIADSLNSPQSQIETVEQPDEIYEDSSSDSDNSTDSQKESDKQKILEDIRKLKMEATKGHEMSEKIMALTSKTVAALLYQNLGESSIIEQDSPSGIQYNSFVANVTQFNENDNEDDIRTLQEVQNPFREKKISKFAEKKTRPQDK